MKRNFINTLLLILFELSTITSAQTINYVFSPDSVENSLKKNVDRNDVAAVSLTTPVPIKIVTIIISIKDHPFINNSWPVIKNSTDYPNEMNPLLGTFPDGTLLRDYLDPSKRESMPVEEWYGPQIEEYFKMNSNGKYLVEAIFPRSASGKALVTKTSYSKFVNNNLGSSEGMVIRYSNWKQMAEEALSDIYIHNPAILKDAKYLNLIYKVTAEEYSPDAYVAFSPDTKFDFFNSYNELLFSGYVSTSFSLETSLHEIFHRVGSIAGAPDGFEGLPDRTTKEFFGLPRNSTWGYDLMCNKGVIPSENALFGVSPLLTMDRIFLGWIEPDEVVTVNYKDIQEIKLTDVNEKLSLRQKADKFYRAAKVMIHPKFDGVHDEYFLVEYRAGTGFDRNFYNVYETVPHKGILIWHIKERTKFLNRSRTNDNLIDLEIGVPYNGWYGNPIPFDDFPRDYQRPSDWRTEVNAAGDYDYLDDKAILPYLPDGGVHRWELTDTTHLDWKPYYLRRNTLRTNFFTDENIRGVVTNKLTNETRPSSRDWDGNLTDIAIYNIKRVDDYMTFDVSYSGGVLDVDDKSIENYNYKLIGNYPNPFNPNTTIEYTIKSLGAGNQETQLATLKVRDILGREVALLVNEKQPPGRYKVEFDGSHLSSGLYFYQLQIDNFSETRKMILIK